MKAVCDTSPLNFLVLIDKVDILPSLFDEIFAPQAVADEFSHPKAPGVVRDRISAPPEWLKIRTVERREDPRLRPGEKEAILLVQDLPADWLIVDEIAARRVSGPSGDRTARSPEQGCGKRSR